VERDANANKKTGSSVRVRDAREELRRVDHCQAEKYGGVREGIRKKGRGRVDGESVYERRESSATSTSPLERRK
jgi:hypothetical protein